MSISIFQISEIKINCRYKIRILIRQIIEFLNQNNKYYLNNPIPPPYYKYCKESIWFTYIEGLMYCSSSGDRICQIGQKGARIVPQGLELLLKN